MFHATAERSVRPDPPNETIADTVLDFLDGPNYPDVGIEINGEMLSVQVQGDLAVAFAELPEAIKAAPEAALDMMTHPDFATLARPFGHDNPAALATGAMLAAADAPEIEVDRALTQSTNAVGRFVEGTATAMVDAVQGIQSLGDMTWDDVRSAVDAVAEDPSILPEAMIEPFREKIAVGDYAGAAGYALPEVVGAIGALGGLRRAADAVPDAHPQLDGPYGGTGNAIGDGPEVGRSSGREFDPDNAGGPILDLDWRTATVDRAGVDDVITHVGRYNDFAPNQMMIDRLERIVAGDLEPTDYDLRYYTHEVRELERYRAMGVPDGVEPGREVWNDAHTATLEDFGLADYDPGTRNSVLYHPDTWELMQ